MGLTGIQYIYINIYIYMEYICVYIYIYIYVHKHVVHLLMSLISLISIMSPMTDNHIERVGASTLQCAALLLWHTRTKAFQKALQTAMRKVCDL